MYGDNIINVNIYWAIQVCSLTPKKTYATYSNGVCCSLLVLTCTRPSSAPSLIGRWCVGGVLAELKSKLWQSLFKWGRDTATVGVVFLDIFFVAKMQQYFTFLPEEYKQGLMKTLQQWFLHLLVHSTMSNVCGRICHHLTVLVMPWWLIKMNISADFLRQGYAATPYLWC